MTWTGQSFSVGQILTAAQMTNLQADITAVANGDSGAPKLQTAAYGTGTVGQAAIGASAVGQGELKSALQQTSGSGTNYYAIGFTGGVYTLGWGIAAAAATPQVRTYNTAAYTAGIGVGDTASFTYYFQAQYMQASPPYDLGYGGISLFIFAAINKSTGQIELIDSAPDAPWHYNGPTNIKADVYGKDISLKYIKPVEIELLKTRTSLVDMSYSNRKVYLSRLREEEPELVELTQDIKNADIDIVPHPFLGNDLSDKSVVLLHPCCDECLDLLALRAQGEKIDVDFANKYLKVNNSAMSVRSPKGVLTVDFKWKSTK